MWGVLDRGAPRWALVDLDLKVIPRGEDDGHALSLLELYEGSRSAARGGSAGGVSFSRRPFVLQLLAPELLPGVLVGADSRSLLDALTGEAISGRRYRAQLSKLTRPGDRPLPSPVGTVISRTVTHTKFARKEYAKYMGAIAAGNMIVRDGRSAYNPHGGNVLLCSDPCSAADVAFYCSAAGGLGASLVLNTSSFRAARYSIPCTWAPSCPSGPGTIPPCCGDCTISEPGYECTYRRFHGISKDACSMKFKANNNDGAP